MLRRIVHWLLKSIKWILLILIGLLIFHLWDFFTLYSDQLVTLTFQHLRMILFAMPPAIFIGVILGIIIYRVNRLSGLVLGGAGIMMTVPSLALFGAMIPLLSPLGAGVGMTPAIIALILYSQLPIIRNTYTGLKNIPHSTVKAARGMGLSNRQILSKIELPLAIPVILTGIRQAVVLSVGIAAVAAYIGGGGLGRWIFGGIRRTYPDMILAGGLAVSLMAIGIDVLLRKVQIWLTQKC
jgi:osmoprotectant transport system permease protein